MIPRVFQRNVDVINTKEGNYLKELFNSIWHKLGAQVCAQYGN